MQHLHISIRFLNCLKSILIFDITEYRLYHAHCECCGHTTKSELPDDASPYQIGPKLQAFIAVLACGHHLSLSKTQKLPRELFCSTFSIGAINEANQRTGKLLKLITELIHEHIKLADHIFIDETSHQRNGEQSSRWLWSMSNGEYVFNEIRYYRNQASAKHMLDDTDAIIISDQHSSYNYLDSNKNQYCWSHIKRNLKQMAEYSGDGYTAKVGAKLHQLSAILFRI